jgi:hypothetical protein
VLRATLSRLGRLPRSAQKLAGALAILGEGATLRQAAMLAGVGEAQAAPSLPPPTVGSHQAPPTEVKVRPPARRGRGAGLGGTRAGGPSGWLRPRL